MSKVIVHIDLNAFFARCEEIRDPSLENKPVAIGHDGRGGIVSTCSYAARKYGVSSAMPMFKARQLCPNLIVIPGDYHYYSAMSKKFFRFIERYTKLVEPASVDECFADFTDVVKGQKDVVMFFRKLKEPHLDLKASVLRLLETYITSLKRMMKKLKTSVVSSSIP